MIIVPQHFQPALRKYSRTSLFCTSDWKIRCAWFPVTILEHSSFKSKARWCSPACWFTSVECYNSALFPVLEVYNSLMEHESKGGSTATLSAGMWTGPGLISNGGLARFYCNLYKMYKTWTFPKIRPLILPLAIGSEKQQVKNPHFITEVVLRQKTVGRSIKTLSSHPPLLVFQYISASCMNYSVGRNVSLFS